jgi:hypothetical protein
MPLVETYVTQRLPTHTLPPTLDVILGYSKRRAQLGLQLQAGTREDPRSLSSLATAVQLYTYSLDGRKWTTLIYYYINCSVSGRTSPPLFKVDGLTDSRGPWTPHLVLLAPLLLGAAPPTSARGGGI